MSQTKNVLKRMMRLPLLVSVGFAALLSLAQTNAALAAATAPNLGDAESFAVLGGQSVTNTGNTIINGDLGISPGNTVTGFPPGVLVAPATIHAADTLAGNAQADLITAYNALIAQACDFGPFGPTDLATQTLVPGVYCYSSSVQNSGTLTLAGTASDVWVFKIGSTLTSGPGSRVNLTGGAQSCNVFWQVGSSATLDTTTVFQGNILALQSITMNTGATLAGRALARNASVTLDTNTTDATVCAGVPPPGGVGLFKIFSPATIDVGGASILTITFTNTSALVANLTADFTDNLPSGMTTVGPPTTTCGGTPPTATASSVTLPIGATIPGGSIATPGLCTLTVNVTAAAIGSFLNTLPAGALVTNRGSSAASPGASLIAAVPTGIPTLNEWGMIIFMVLVGLMSIYYLRRQKVKA